MYKNLSLIKDKSALYAFITAVNSLKYSVLNIELKEGNIIPAAYANSVIDSYSFQAIVAKDGLTYLTINKAMKYLVSINAIHKLKPGTYVINPDFIQGYELCNDGSSFDIHKYIYDYLKINSPAG